MLLLREKAEMLEATKSLLRSSNQAVPVPLVIRLVHYVRLPHRKVPAKRVLRSCCHAYTCQYCGGALDAVG